MPKHSSKGKDIVARSITLKDAKGKVRIYLGVHDNPASSVICLFGDNNRSIQLSADHEGGLFLGLRDGSDKIAGGISITSDDRVGLFLYDHRSETRTELGSDSKDGEHQIKLHHQGKLRWTTKKKTKRTKAGG